MDLRDRDLHEHWRQAMHSIIFSRWRDSPRSLFCKAIVFLSEKNIRLFTKIYSACARLLPSGLVELKMSFNCFGKSYVVLNIGIFRSLGDARLLSIANDKTRKAARQYFNKFDSLEFRHPKWDVSPSRHFPVFHLHLQNYVQLYVSNPFSVAKRASKNSAPTNKTSVLSLAH